MQLSTRTQIINNFFMNLFFMLKNKKFMFLGMIGGLAFAVALMTTVASAQVSTYSQISGNTVLNTGSKSSDVIVLQKFLASNSNIYPAGVVSGYYGSMTKAAVTQFQLAYGLSADGVSGPMTSSKINSLISYGAGIDLYAPVLSSLSINESGTSANFSFNSNKPVKATIFYDTNPINWNSWDDSVQSLALPAISGIAETDNTFSLTKQITLSNLSQNINYHYVLVLTDGSGNSTVTWPSTFMSQ
jgi:peptidoglycan hydrolase-like protein with peptidoglycan-binding domain